MCAKQNGILWHSLCFQRIAEQRNRNRIAQPTEERENGIEQEHRKIDRHSVSQSVAPFAIIHEHQMCSTQSFNIITSHQKRKNM